MADNVNIIVQDTINEIVVNAAVVVETIDINVQAAVDTVDIVANPNNYVVNINRIIGEQVQSDWTQTDNQAPDYIKNKPTIPAAQVNSDWNATSGVAEILNKPILATVATSGDYTDLLNTPTIPTATSDLTNDGEDGVNPFITAADIPPVTGFVPYTGATEDVNLGEFGLLTGNVEFDNTPTNIPTTAGAMYWNDADGTADLILKGGNVKLQIGQESVIRVVNKTATNINLLEANYQAVRVTGAQGQRLKVDLAQATNDNLSAETIGLVTETINNNQEGFITTSGLVRNINTTGSLQGETWADGDILYLSATTAGNVTKVKPTAPNHLVIIGYVVHAHANQGSIFVKVDNGYELDELHNVKITSAANNNVLAYTSATDIWENKTVETALGYTPENVANKSTSTSLGTSDTLYPTQNAVKVYADTKFTLPSLTSGSVLFSNGTTIAQDNSNLFWDDTNNFLGIGTSSPSSALTLNGKATIINDNNIDFVTSTGPNLLRGIGFFGATQERAVFKMNHSSGELRIGTIVAGGYFPTFYSNGSEAFRIATTRNVLINTTTDAGFKLDVNGTARVRTSSGSYVAPLTIENTGTASVDFKNVAMFIGNRGNNSNIDDNTNIGLQQKNNTVNNYGIVNFFNSAFNLSAFFGCQYVSHGASPTGNLIFGTSNSGAVSEKMRIFANGNVSINTTTDVASSQLTVESTTKGFLPPRMTTTQKNAIATPAAGLVVYDTTLGKLCVRTAAAWETITSI